MGLLDRFRRQKPSSDEKGVYLATIREDGVEKLFVTLLTPEDMERQGLPPEAILGRLKEKSPDSGSRFTPDNFVPNGTFILFLHDVVARRGCEDPELVEKARGVTDKMGLFLDRRRKGAADIVREDLIGAFEIRDGELVAGSYQPNEFYEVVSKDGLMTLDPWLRGVLLEEIRKLPMVSK
jgi:hypothetical protein